MPIKLENRALYPRNWRALSLSVRERAGWRCEGIPSFPDCRAAHGEPHPVTGSKVVLTTAHLDHDPRNNQSSNLRALCQRCHNTYDQPHRQVSASKTRHFKRGQPDLFAAVVGAGE